MDQFEVTFFFFFEFELTLRTHWKTTEQANVPQRSESFHGLIIWQNDFFLLILFKVNKIYLNQMSNNYIIMAI